MNSTVYWPEDGGPTGATLWRLVEVDACEDPDDGWTWNTASTLKRFRSESINLKGLLLRVLRDVRGKRLPPGVFRVDDSDWNIVEVQRRADGCPIWAIMRESPR